MSHEAWIEGSVRLGDLSAERTGELFHELSSRFYPYAKKIMPCAAIHSTLVYIGCEVGETLLEYVRTMGLESLQFECEIHQLQPGDTSADKLLLVLHSDEYCDVFKKTYDDLVERGIQPQHTVQDKMKYRHGFTVHITLAEFHTKLNAFEAMVFNTAYESILRKSGSKITVSDFHLYADDDDGKTHLIL